MGRCRIDWKTCSCLVTLLVCQAGHADQSWLYQIEEQFENKRLLKLATAQQSQTINKFTTDGCSGGMSQAWDFFAQALPVFAKQLKDQPPWQDCCVAHDRLYWRGATKNGYQKRQAADLKLQICVIKTGERLAPRLEQQYKIPKATIESIFSTTADIMYTAVRLGGKPCTPFPWRWGYGWPMCSLWFDL